MLDGTELLENERQLTASELKQLLLEELDDAIELDEPTIEALAHGMASLMRLTA